MDQVEVDILEAELTDAARERPLGAREIGRPQLRRYPNVLAGNTAAPHALADAALVGVEPRRVDVAVARLERPANRFDRRLAVRDLPNAEADERQLTPIAKSSCWRHARETILPAMSVSSDERLFALRGATSVPANSEPAILEATESLMRELIERNGLEPARIVSCIFTVTADLDAAFPAVAARRLGLDGVPLLCAREIDVPGALPSVIRVLMHHYAPADHSARHVYLGEARSLREDLDAAQ